MGSNGLVNIEKRSSLWLGLLVIVLSIVFIFASVGRTDLTVWIAVIFGFFLSGFLFIEAGIFTYFQKKDFRKFGFGDIVVFLTVGVAVGVFLNTLLLTNFVSASPPEWLVNFATTTGVTVGSLAGVLGIVHIVAPRFR